MRKRAKKFQKEQADKLASEQAHRRVGGPEDHKLTSSDQASDEDSSNKR
jgi:hypothetical protein